MNENLRFSAAGKFTSRGKWIHGDFTVPTTEIIIVTEGSVKMEEDGKRYELTPGSVLFLSPHIRHFGYDPSGERVSFYWIHMDGFDALDNGELEKCFTLTEPHHVSILCRQLLHYHSRGAGADILTSLLRVLTHELSRQCRLEGSENALANRIHEWIRANADQSITAENAAEKFGYNEDYITRLIKKHYGVGLKALICEMKLNLIEHLLLERDLTLAEIADLSGFSDYKLFLKFFKYHAGMTPGEFKRLYYAMHTNSR